MKVGGHETFVPRPGWLTKGLFHLQETGDGSFSSSDVADALGVGRNMSKSIGWWMRVTGLAKRESRTAPLEISDFGRVVIEQDPYMTRLETWWLVHAMTLTSYSGSAIPLFFSPRRSERTYREKLGEELNAELYKLNKKEPSKRSIQREVSTILNAYSVPVPRSAGDPEDNLGSPLQRLELFRHVRATDRFERGDPTPAPPEALGILLSSLETAQGSHDLEPGTVLTVSVNGDTMARVCAALGRSIDGVLDLASQGSDGLGGERMDVAFHAGERVVTVTTLPGAEWASLCYGRVQPSTRKRAA